MLEKHIPLTSFIYTLVKTENFSRVRNIFCRTAKNFQKVTTPARSIAYEMYHV